jgi:hypothetical protein
VRRKNSFDCLLVPNFTRYCTGRYKYQYSTFDTYSGVHCTSNGIFPAFTLLITHTQSSLSYCFMYGAILPVLIIYCYGTPYGTVQYITVPVPRTGTSTFNMKYTINYVQYCTELVLHGR